MRWSPDGKSVFFEVEQGSVEGTYADLQFRVYSVDVASAKPTRWAATFDGSVTGYASTSKLDLLASGMLGTATALYQQACAARRLPQARRMAGHLRARHRGANLLAHRLHLLRSRQAHRGLHRRQRRPTVHRAPDHVLQQALHRARPPQRQALPLDLRRRHSRRRLSPLSAGQVRGQEPPSLRPHPRRPHGRRRQLLRRRLVQLGHVRRQPGMAGLPPQLSRLRRLRRQVRDWPSCPRSSPRPAATSSPVSTRW